MAIGFRSEISIEYVSASAMYEPLRLISTFKFAVVFLLIGHLPWDK